MERIVIIYGEECAVGSFQRSKAVWVTHGKYRGRVRADPGCRNRELDLCRASVRRWAGLSCWAYVTDLHPPSRRIGGQAEDKSPIGDLSKIQNLAKSLVPRPDSNQHGLSDNRF